MLSVNGDRYEFEMNMLLECAREGIRFYEVPIETVYLGKTNHHILILSKTHGGYTRIY